MLARHDHRDDGFAQIGMLHADDGHFADDRQFTDRIFHFGGIDVEAAGDNQVFFASYDRDISSLIDPAHVRSEEHTYELQSLLRISYAVFCLKQKKTNMKN